MIYTVCAQRDTWLSREIHLLLSLRTPQASIPRDMGVEFIISQHRLLLKVTHPQKNILIQGLCHRKPFIDILHFRIQWIVKPELFFHHQSLTGQLDHVKNTHTAKLELLMDHTHHYYLKVRNVYI